MSPKRQPTVKPLRHLIASRVPLTTREAVERSTSVRPPAGARARREQPLQVIRLSVQGEDGPLEASAGANVRDLDLAQGRIKQGKRKVGRPLSYSGDPDNPLLTSEERRKLRRRACNRESAHRVRERKSAKLEELSLRIEELEACREEALARTEEATQGREELEAAIGRMQASMVACKAENGRLEEEIRRLRQLDQEHIQQQRMLRPQQIPNLGGVLRAASLFPSSSSAAASPWEGNEGLAADSWIDHVLESSVNGHTGFEPDLPSSRLLCNLQSISGGDASCCLPMPHLSHHASSFGLGRGDLSVPADLPEAGFLPDTRADFKPF